LRDELNFERKLRDEIGYSAFVLLNTYVRCSCDKENIQIYMSLKFIFKLGSVAIGEGGKGLFVHPEGLFYIKKHLTTNTMPVSYRDYIFFKKYSPSLPFSIIQKVHL
jgi:hypothetical protein